MKTKLSLTALSLVLVLALACAGTKARQEALLPAMRLAWSGIVEDVAVGVTELPPTEAAAAVAAADEMTAALEAKDPGRVLLVPWEGVLRAVALRGIDLRVVGGEIGPGVADSLRERVRNFDESMTALRTAP